MAVKNLTGKPLTNSSVLPREREQLVNNVNVCQFGQVEELNELQTEAANEQQRITHCAAPQGMQ